MRVDWTIVATEAEALQLEFSWIKQYAPTYNIQFRDDKSYPYLAISEGDEFPRVFITRKSKRPGLTYFGPYINTWALRSTFDVILKIFPIRSCTTGNFERARKSKRQCLLGDIGKCAAPCVGWISQPEHKELSSRLPFPFAQVESILQELEIRNLVSIGFFTQTNDGEFILRVDEYRITGGQVDVSDYQEGIYLYTIEADGQKITHRMTVRK